MGVIIVNLWDVYRVIAQAKVDEHNFHDGEGNHAKVEDVPFGAKEIPEPVTVHVDEHLGRRQPAARQSPAT